MDNQDIYPKWKDKLLIPTQRSAEELDNINLDLDDVATILEEGFDCSKSKRAENLIERCKQKGNKIIKIVIAEMENYLKIIHAGQFTISKKIREKIKEEDNENKM